MIFRFLNLLGWLILIETSAFSQEQFVQFTYYDQITWSPDGKQLAFRCILLDESQPERLTVNVLIKDLTSDRLICLDPQPERFVISQDKKYLLFSSIYGLYWMSLEKPVPPVQIYFRNPAANWYFQDFGFLKKKASLYVDRYDNSSGEVVREYYQLPAMKTTISTIEWSELKNINKIGSLEFNLPNAELRGNQMPEVKLNKALVKFVPQSEPGNYELVYQLALPKAAPEILLKECRPRLLSGNPAKTEVIVSAFQSNGHQTYRFSVNSKKLIPIENKRYFSLSWLDDSRYICVTEDGLFKRNIDMSLNKKMSHWQLRAWCESIDLSFLQYELQVGFEPEKKAAEQLSAKLSKAGYSPRITYFKDQAKAGYRIRVGGFADRKAAQEAGEKLRKDGFDFWIDQIADCYDYFNSQREAERQAFKQEKEAIIEYKFENYLRSRIVLKMPNKNEQVIVEEMNNIPGREPW